MSKGALERLRIARKGGGDFVSLTIADAVLELADRISEIERGLNELDESAISLAREVASDNNQLEGRIAALEVRQQTIVNNLNVLAPFPETAPSAVPEEDEGLASIDRALMLLEAYGGMLFPLGIGKESREILAKARAAAARLRSAPREPEGERGVLAIAADIRGTAAKLIARAADREDDEARFLVRMAQACDHHADDLGYYRAPSTSEPKGGPDE